MNDEGLRRTVADLARHSANIAIAAHARARMRKRHILWTQVQQVLLRGRVVESAHRDIYGCWKCTLQLAVSGDAIKVAVALEEGDLGRRVIVITVMN